MQFDVSFLFYCDMDHITSENSNKNYICLLIFVEKNKSELSFNIRHMGS